MVVEMYQACLLRMLLFEIENPEIGYTFNAEEIGVKNLRIYASGQNLLTVTDYMD
jgi:hypothetical protein